MPVNTFSQIVLYRVGIVCRPHQTILRLYCVLEDSYKEPDLSRFKVGRNYRQL